MERRLYRKGPAFERLQNEGSAEEVERFARRTFLEHLETKYGKLHVGRLWKESKIEDTRGWLQVRDSGPQGLGYVGVWGIHGLSFFFQIFRLSDSSGFP